MPEKTTHEESTSAERLAREQAERFDRVYTKDDETYGSDPSPEIDSFVEQCVHGGRALDLGAGLGRDTLALARRGIEVTAVDVAEAGLEKIAESARAAGLADLVNTRTGDLRTMEFEPDAHDVIVAATVLDHMALEDALPVLDRLAGSLKPGGALYVEVHTTEDPGSPVGSGARKLGPESETAASVVHYFRSNELLGLLAERFRVIYYEERLEWDATHGKPHEHGKAVALCVRKGSHPRYFGEKAKGLHRE
jgi:2-polyprenyl-3-methyl-5-hydroxy-6-metoxy-1,4-benzoquinol methylase